PHSPHASPSISSCIHSSLPYFFLLIRPPSRSTLFPYTTLFRSLVGASVHLAPFPTDLGRRASELLQAMAAVRKLASLARAREARDRKSTRLNSSHVAISYAVFCLKKKKKKKQRNREDLER